MNKSLVILELILGADLACPLPGFGNPEYPHAGLWPQPNDSHSRSNTVLKFNKKNKEWSVKKPEECCQMKAEIEIGSFDPKVHFLRLTDASLIDTSGQIPYATVTKKRVLIFSSEQSSRPGGDRALSENPTQRHLLFRPISHLQMDLSRPCPFLLPSCQPLKRMIP